MTKPPSIRCWARRHHRKNEKLFEISFFCGSKIVESCSSLISVNPDCSQIAILSLLYAADGTRENFLVHLGFMPIINVYEQLFFLLLCWFNFQHPQLARTKKTSSRIPSTAESNLYLYFFPFAFFSSLLLLPVIHKLNNRKLFFLSSLSRWTQISEHGGNGIEWCCFLCRVTLLNIH